jgi:hypothetical protein
MLMRFLTAPLSMMTIILAVFFLAKDVPAAFGDEAREGLVGHWEFDDGTGRDLSGNGNDAVLLGTQIVSLEGGRSCVMLMPETGPI